MCIFLIVVFGLAWGHLIYTSYGAIQNISTPQLIYIIVKQLVITAFFAGTVTFFISWNNRWFQQHAQEEFRLKRMELDIDRASWVVEMLFEWNETKDKPLPQGLIETLTKNLFVETTNTSQDFNPTN